MGQITKIKDQGGEEKKGGISIHRREEGGSRRHPPTHFGVPGGGKTLRGVQGTMLIAVTKEGGGGRGRVCHSPTRFREGERGLPVSSRRVLLPPSRGGKDGGTPLQRERGPFTSKKGKGDIYFSLVTKRGGRGLSNFLISYLM